MAQLHLVLVLGILVRALAFTSLLRHEGRSSSALSLRVPMSRVGRGNKTLDAVAAPSPLLRSAANASSMSASLHNTGGAPGAGSVMAYGSPPGVVHFLFMVINDIPQADIWQKFFADAPKGSYTALVHCKDSEGCKRTGLLKKVPELQQVPTVNSWYCHDLVTAMVHIMKVAADLHAAPSGAPEKFVFISDSTLPVKPFSEVHAQLSSNTLSDFCFYPSDQWTYGKIDGHDVGLLKHHQWVVLNREHADMMIKEWVPVDARSVWHVPLKGGSWTGKERFVSPQHFNYPRHGMCPDEWAIFTTIFGATEYPGQNGIRAYPGLSGPPIKLWGNGALTTQGVCRTYSYWKNTDGEVFANVAGQISADIHSKVSCYPECGQHPATLEWLSDASLSVLRSSPFLFARKFSANVWMPNYYSLVLADSNSATASSMSDFWAKRR